MLNGVSCCQGVDLMASSEGFAFTRFSLPQLGRGAHSLLQPHNQAGSWGISHVWSLCTWGSAVCISSWL